MTQRCQILLHTQPQKARCCVMIHRYTHASSFNTAGSTLRMNLYKNLTFTTSICSTSNFISSALMFKADPYGLVKWSSWQIWLDGIFPPQASTQICHLQSNRPCRAVLDPHTLLEEDNTAKVRNEAEVDLCMCVHTHKHQ